jgi:hypothetical protein
MTSCSKLHSAKRRAPCARWLRRLQKIECESLAENVTNVQVPLPSYDFRTKITNVIDAGVRTAAPPQDASRVVCENKQSNFEDDSLEDIEISVA